MFHRSSDIGRLIASGHGIHSADDLRTLAQGLTPSARIECLLAALIEEVQQMRESQRLPIADHARKLPVRVRNILARSGWDFVDQIKVHQLRWMAGVGPATVQLIQAWAASLGVPLADPGPAFGPMDAAAEPTADTVQ